MSYAVRNSLVLLVLLVLVAGGGGWWVFGHEMGGLAKLHAERDRTWQEIQDLGDVNAALVDVNQRLEATKKRWSELPKVIPPSDEPAVTYDYLNQIISRPEAAVSYNFVHQGSGGDKMVRWNRYLIQDGSGTFAALYGFLWRLENQRQLYGIQNLSMDEQRTTDEKTGAPRSLVGFSCELMAYYMPGVERPAVLPGEDFVRFRAVEFNPFRPLLYETLPPNVEELVEVEGSQLMGISGRTIYLRDQKGAPVSLKVGDRVYLGRLARVDAVRGQAVFSLNKGGLGETYTLTLSESAGKARGK